MVKQLRPMKPDARIMGWVVLPLLVFLLNFGLKYACIDTVQIGLDEPSTIFYAQMPPAQIMREYAFSNSPPLLELILHHWMQVFGASPAAVRFPSMLFACCTAVLLYGLGWRLHSQRVGLWAALLYTLSSYMTYFAHEARVYALFGMLTVAALLCLLWLRDRPGSWGRTLLFAAVSLLLSYSHYFAFFVIAWQCLWVLLAPHPQRRALLWRVGLAMGLVALWYVPSAVTLLLRAERTAGDHWVGLSSLAGLYHTLAKYLNQPVVTVAALAVLAGAGLRWLWLRSKRRAGFSPEVVLVLGIFPGAILLVWGMGMAFPMFLDRYLIFSMALLYLVLALACAYLLRRTWQQWVLAGVLLALLGATTDLAKDAGSEWREVAAKVRARWTPGDAVLLHPEYPHFAFSYHFDQAVFRDHAHYDTRLRAAGIYRVLRHRPLPMDTLARAPHIWVVQAGSPASGLPPSLNSLLQTSFQPAPAVPGNHGISITCHQNR